MKATLDIDPDLLEAAENEARATHQNIGAIISEWAKRGLTHRGFKYEDGIPVFIVPPDAPPITNEMVKEAMDSEGLPS